jgi:hypothetical protein
MDERLIHGATFKAHDHNHYLAWSNALTRTLARLGLKGAAAQPPTFDQVAAEIIAARSAA